MKTWLGLGKGRVGCGDAVPIIVHRQHRLHLCLLQVTRIYRALSDLVFSLSHYIQSLTSPSIHNNNSSWDDGDFDRLSSVSVEGNFFRYSFRELCAESDSQRGDSSTRYGSSMIASSFLKNVIK